VTSDDDISMSDDSDDVDNLLNDIGHSSDDSLPNEVLVDAIIHRDDVEDEEKEEDEDDDEEEEEEDELVSAFISASTDRNRNHPPNLSVGNVSIGGFSFHPNTNVIALGLSNGDIAM